MSELFTELSLGKFFESQVEKQPDHEFIVLNAFTIETHQYLKQDGAQRDGTHDDSSYTHDWNQANKNEKNDTRCRSHRTHHNGHSNTYNSRWNHQNIKELAYLETQEVEHQCNEQSHSYRIIIASQYISHYILRFFNHPHTGLSDELV